MKKNVAIGIGLVIAFSAVAVIGLQLSGKGSLAQLADMANQETEKPDTVSNQQLTKITDVKEKVQVQTRAHLVNDTYNMAAGTERTLTFTTAPASSAYIVGNATTSGGFRFYVKPVGGNCPVLDCQSVAISSLAAPGFEKTKTESIKLLATPGTEQELIIENMQGDASVSVNFDIVYIDTKVQEPQDDQKPSAKEQPSSLFEPAK